jgi:ABC-2 type transport system permease protein
MRLFFELARKSFRRYLTYRAAAVAGLITNFFFGLMRVAVLLALFGDNQQVEGFTIAGVITYTALTQAVIAYLGMFGWYDLMNSIHSGEVAADLLKPMNYLSFWLAQDLGRAAVNFLLRGVTIMIAYALIFDLAYPETAAQWLALICSVMLSWLVSFAWRFLINLPAFWTPNALGFGRFGFVISWFFSGFLMPLRFLPDWIQQIARLTPFPHMLNTVVEVYLGVLQGPALARALLIQVLWVLLLFVLAQLILRTAVRRLVILGG